jgi:hypothetical protein
MAATAAGTAGAAPAESSSQARRRAAERRRPVAEKVGWIGVRAIQVDAGTGQLRVPTPAEATELAASLRAMLHRSGADVRTEQRSDGMRQAHLHGRFLNVVLSRPGANGTTETFCATSFDEATSFLGLRPDAAGVTE